MKTYEGNLALKIQKDIQHGLYAGKYRRIFGRHYPPMRMKKSGRIEGITIINDSGATCLDATYFSLRKIPQNLTWIVWNENPAVAFDRWDRSLLTHVRRIIAVGKSYEKLRLVFGDTAEVYPARTPDSALKKAVRITRPGEKILISHATPFPGDIPAEKVFDIFEKLIKKTTAG